MSRLFFESHCSLTSRSRGALFFPECYRARNGQSSVSSVSVYPKSVISSSDAMNASWLLFKQKKLFGQISLEMINRKKLQYSLAQTFLSDSSVQSIPLQH